MKKVFLFLATAALFASCSDDLLEPNNGFQAQDLSSKGITFRVVEDNATTRGMMEPKQDEQGKTTYRAFFFAEKDKINIWASDAVLGETRLYAWTNNASGQLNALNAATSGTATSNMATYKATRSEGDPHFTAVSDDDLLNLVNYSFDQGTQSKVETVGKFFAVYPALGENQGVSYVPAVTTGDNQTPERFKIAARNLASQSYDGFLDLDERLMFAYAEDSKGSTDIKEQNKSVGESVDLRFKSPLSQAVFQIKSLGADAKGFGNLISITIKSQYTPLVPNTIFYTDFNAVTASLVDMGSSSTHEYYLEGDLTREFNDDGTFNGYKKTEGKAITDDSFGEDKRFSTTGIPADYFTFTPKTNGEHEIAYVSNSVYIKEATLTVGKAITEGEKMNLYVLPTTGHSATQQEKYTITYTFDNVTLTYDKTTDKNFTANTGGLMFSLDIPATFKYIVTNNAKDEEGTEIEHSRTLIVNQGMLTDIFKKEDNAYTTMLNWGEEGVSASEVGTIIINEGAGAFVSTAEDNNDDWDLLNKFENAKVLKIYGNKTTDLVNVASLKLDTLIANGVEKVAENAFGGTTTNTKENTALKGLYLNSVTDFAPQKVSFTKITHLDLHAYKSFMQENNPQVAPSQLITSALVDVDLSSLTSLTSEYGSSVYITFEGFTSLKEVTLNESGVVVNGNQFKGCTSLESVAGVLDITTADGVFSGCNSEKLTTVHINGDVIPANAFNGSKIKNIYVGSKDSESQVEPSKIGKYAFYGNTAISTMDLSKAETIGEGAFDGATNFVGKDGEAVLKVATVAKCAFNKTAIVHFDLINATKTEDGSLASTKVEQIRYQKDLAEKAETSPISVSQVNTYTTVLNADATDYASVTKDTSSGSDRKSFVEIFLADVNDASLFTGYKNRK